MNSAASESLVDRVGRIAVAAMITTTTAVMLGPVLTTLSLSFSETFTFPPTGFTLRWYENVLARPAFVNGLIVSMLLGLSTVVVATIIGVGLSLIMARQRFRGRGLLQIVLVSPIALPRVAIGVSLFLFVVGIGLRGAWPRLVLLHLIMTCPYVVAAVTASLQGLDRKVEEAAMNLGAGPVETFRRVTLPLIRPGIVGGAVFAMVISFEEVTASVFLTDARTVTFPVVLFAYLARGDVEPTIAAASTIMLVLVMAVVAVFGRYVGLARAIGLSRR